MTMAQAVNIHVPRVLAWNKHHNPVQNPVRSPYILMEDVKGTTLDRPGDYFQRSKAINRLPDKVIEGMVKQMVPSLSRLGSIYFAEDFPSSGPLLAPGQVVANGIQPVTDKLRVGPIADMLWWRPFHDEPHLDRGPWDTMEECIRAAVLIERRAIERHRADPSSLAYTRSTLNDLDTIERLLDKVDVLAPHLQHAIERASPCPERFTQNVFVHPDICPENVMIPPSTSENAVEDTLHPVMIDWEDTVVLPFAIQFYKPGLVIFEPWALVPGPTGWTSVRESSAPSDAPWPDYDKMSPEIGQVTRVAMFPHFRALLPLVLRACADGPAGLWWTLARIKEVWDRDQHIYGPCPLPFEPKEMEQAQRAMDELQDELEVSELLATRLGCSWEGFVEEEDDYEEALRELEDAKKDWDKDVPGQLFPFREGGYTDYLR
ncbi:hypothetical protein EST38_g2816 [Candolleomyces aberdarensis]|uniref:Altered inheritance of mitochondria protein 9, mitochondrial n=1 Tax=Candolleomyces aberdarensis TaxID=2316362 RepID=A0A4V1Q4R9_9AGAR|nr:hypothetical protein EST38_g2816 [Candolleomyces aberdarensis]